MALIDWASAVLNESARVQMADLTPARARYWQKPSNHFKTLLQFIEQLRVFGSKLVWLSMSGVFARLCCSGRHQRYEKRADEARHIFRTYLR